MIPQKRWIDSEEIAELAKYLISDAAQGITGQSFKPLRRTKLRMIFPLFL